jgi:RNA polymerase sigma-70 factor (ECF subfamily)
MGNQAKIAEKKTIEPAASLIPACLRGDDRARETLARWCLPKVRRTVMLTYGAGPDADDLCQIAISRVFAKLDAYRGDAKFYTWVDRITVNAIRDHYRSRKARAVWESHTSPREDQITSRDEPDAEYERYRLMECLSEHLACIKLNRRNPVVMALAHGYTAPEIASLLDIKVEAAKKRLQRGRRELLALLKQDPLFGEVMKEMMQ